MKVLILGGTGMLGHKMYQVIGQAIPETWCALHTKVPDDIASAYIFPHSERVITDVDLLNLNAAEQLIDHYRFDVVVNCVGVIKQRDTAADAITSITINSLLPHRLAALLSRWGGRLVHFSTDCVFSGRRGRYSENDISDAEDLYGRSKYLGEVAGDGALTLRTSIIGRELRYHTSLLDWFLTQADETIRGFRRAWWSGVTTNHLADLVVQLLLEHPTLSGLYQVSSGRITKYDLLLKLRDAYHLSTNIIPDDEVYCDRSLQGDRLRDTIGYEAPPWQDQIAQLISDPTPYPSMISARGSSQQ